VPSPPAKALAGARARRATPDGWRKAVIRGTRYRAKKKGIVFDLTADDLIFPEFCPVLGVKLEPGNGLSANSPSIDRVDNSKGYTKDNVRVISTRANSLKSDATLAEIQKLLAYMEGKR
jgi:hypothetical protein